MSAEKIGKEYKYSIEPKAENKDIFLKLKKAIMKTQKELNFDDDVANFLSYFCDRAAEGRKVTIVDETDLWNITQTAKELGVTRPTVYRMIDRGDLEAVEFDGLKIVPSSVTAFLKRKEANRKEALKKVHKIDKKLKKETRDLLSKSDEDNFEEIDL